MLVRAWGEDAVTAARYDYRSWSYEAGEEWRHAGKQYKRVFDIDALPAQYVFSHNHGSASLPLASKGKLYRCLLLGVLLYGCESWVLTSKLRQRLSALHNHCVRAMARKKPLRASSSDYIFKNAALAPQYLNNVGFNLDRQAVGFGVSTSWGKAAQDKASWRKLTRLPDVKIIFK
ncbi:hypothetical protein T492DRAFT_894269 [Pavlovales sp. CCMP2436]|nr:hypothetical protein T492DRAFT_894269 [Pavlovales sp. CCMP2436]